MRRVLYRWEVFSLPQLSLLFSNRILFEILKKYQLASETALVTRLTKEKAEKLLIDFPSAKFHEISSCLTMGSFEECISSKEEVIILTGGTSDLGVASESEIALYLQGIITKLLFDVGVDADGNVDYSAAPQNPINSGLQIESNIDSNLKFETLGEIDFTVSGSPDVPPVGAPTSFNANGEATGYTLTRFVQAVSGETKTKSFTVTSPTKFLELDLGEDLSLIHI